MPHFSLTLMMGGFTITFHSFLKSQKDFGHKFTQICTDDKINDMNSPTKHKCSHHSINKTTEPSQLNPGDTVIPLADLVVKATIISGSINSAIITWKFNQSWWLTLAAFVIGAVVCWFLARRIGSLVFPVTQFDDIFVVKAGSSAIPLTLKASFIGSSTALILCGFLYAFILGASPLFVSTWVIVTLISLIVGGLWGMLTALL